MPDLVIDLQTLESLHNQLTTASAAFADASAISAGLADSVGHDGKANELAGKVADFASTWQYRRESITASLDTINRTVKIIHDAFVTADSDLSHALTANG